jgi:hypothetical protein
MDYIAISWRSANILLTLVDILGTTSEIVYIDLSSFNQNFSALLYYKPRNLNSLFLQQFYGQKLLK